MDMTGDDMVQLLWAGAALVLVGSALLARRMPLGRTLAMIAAWIAIFAAGFLLFTFAQPIGQAFRLAVNAERGTVDGATLRIPMAPDGHFWVRGTVDGVATRFLIDSGASLTAISADTVAAAGLEPRRGAFPMRVQTANGVVVAERVTIGRLTIGPIERRDFRAITAPQFGTANVLGMNFLSSLAGWGVERNVLVLRP